jgi:GT2 family glycosyltransferase
MITSQRLEKIPNLKLIINQKNLGYTKANNLGVKESSGEYLAIVNPDISWKHLDTLQKLIDFLENNSDVGIVAPGQISELTGKSEMTVRAFPKLYNQIFRRTFLRHIPPFKQLVAYDEMRHLDYSKTQNVDWLQSSFIMLKRELWDQIGGFDEDYFLFMSDPQICREAWQRGRRVVYYPAAKVYADGVRVSAGGIKKFFQSWVMRQHLKDSCRYTLKNLFQRNPRKKYEKALRVKS